MTAMMSVYERLLAQFGDLGWWPAESPYEVMVGAVLTQNTAWSNVEKAIARFGGKLTPQRVAAMPPEELAEIIRPAGFFNQKASYLQAVTAWYAGYAYETGRVTAAGRRDLPGLRAELLRVRGVGRETADSILLYAFGLPVMVVDAYTRRLLTRLGWRLPPDYEGLRACVTAEIPADAALMNRLHALIVEECKQYCRAKPQCQACPLAGECPVRGTSGV